MLWGLSRLLTWNIFFLGWASVNQEIHQIKQKCLPLEVHIIKMLIFLILNFLDISLNPNLLYFSVSQSIHKHFHGLIVAVLRCLSFLFCLCT